MVRKNHAVAASATVGFEVSEPIILVGDQFTISLTIDTDNYLGDFEGNISYDSSMIEYLSGPSCVAGGDGILRIEDTEASSSWNERNYVLTFEAIGIGDCELSLVGAPVAYDYESQEPMSLSSTSKVIQISAPKSASTNVELADLKIRPSSLTPSFDSSVTEYSTIVDSTTTRLIISAISQDSNAKVEIEGNQDFIIGSNDVRIIVVSEAGTKKEYTIHVVKEDEALLTVTPDESKEEQYTIHASLVDGVTVLKGTYTYNVVISEEGILIPKGYEKTSIKIDGYTVPVYQLSGNVEDDYLLLILQNQFGQANLYRYDRIEKSIQRYTGDRVIIQNATDNSELELTNQKKEYEHQLGQKNLLVVVLAGFSVVLLIGIISLFLKTRYHNDDDL
jgi:hypothetical protein